MQVKLVFGLFILIALVQSEECVDKLEWSTANGQVVVNGQPLVLKGIKYPGFETTNFAPLGLYYQKLDDILDVIKTSNFNAIQLPFSMEMLRENPRVDNNQIKCELNADLCNMSSISMMDTVIDRAAARGLLIVLSNDAFVADPSSPEYSSTLWYHSKFTEAAVTNLWKTLISRYRGRWNVFAIDLKNGPDGDATWGDSNADTDWNKGAERMIKNLNTFNGLFLVDGVSWGSELENAEKYPINTENEVLNKRVVYTPNCYGPGIYNLDELLTDDFPNNLDAIYMKRFGFLTSKGHAVVIGDWGAQFYNEQWTHGERWSKWFIDWMRKKCLTNNIYWTIDPTSEFENGLLETDWKTPIPEILAFLNRTQPNPTKFEARDGKICISKGVFPEKHCQKP